jgi:hypothetical protein
MSPLALITKVQRLFIESTHLDTVKLGKFTQKCTIELSSSSNVLYRFPLKDLLATPKCSLWG